MTHANILEQHRTTWQHKKILRLIYHEWYQWILADLAALGQTTIELGAGSGNFKEFKADVIASDISCHSWLDVCFDALHMPFKSDSAANLVLIDVLHHLADPVSFFLEAARILPQGGRILLLEPYPSLFSLFIYRRVHPEPFIMDANYTTNHSLTNRETPPKDPWEANQAMAYVLFFKAKEQFLRWLSDTYQVHFKVIKQKRVSCILYPASGGFEHRALIPDGVIPLFRILERVLTPFRRWLAFRCYVVLEKC